jgi:hypothetical protein
MSYPGRLSVMLTLQPIFSFTSRDVVPGRHYKGKQGRSNGNDGPDTGPSTESDVFVLTHSLISSQLNSSLQPGNLLSGQNPLGINNI